MSVSPAYRRIAAIVVTVVAVVALFVVGMYVQVPYVAMGPGPTVNTLGDVTIDEQGKDGKVVASERQVVDITGAQLDKTDGHLNLTTVSVYDGLNLFDALSKWASGRYTLEPREQVYPPGQSNQQVRDANAAQMSGSEAAAQAAALSYLHRPTKLTIAAIGKDAPASKGLKVGDQVISVSGTPVSTTAQMQKAVRAHKPGDKLDLAIVRDGTPQNVVVTLGGWPDGAPAEVKGTGYLGVTPQVLNADPKLKIDFNVGDIGGPSAGLMLTLAVVDRLSPGSLTGGRFIAGTGTISDSGVVGPIGGITHKTLAAREAGATMFLVPAANCAEAKSDAPDGLELVKVDSLDTAVGVLTGKVARQGC
ncbi:PDZ domain-containing protein [Gordonia sp. TBRC 11910]|uniref:endopeptidase La n=1 Tax=Gordonia asplenii TaxID=2725283 RepID=A0A848KV32_9ACTN|nr:PDZ domain-containing protein [Gordonia asplenii]NMO01897.1 PDZ domain-containing protein [Gordonia asplenii]